MKEEYGEQALFYYSSVLQKTTIADRVSNMATTNYRALERIIKGFGNHRRLQILELLRKNPELSVADIAEQLSIGYENASDHIRKMAIAGLVLKRNEGSAVLHKLTPRAELILVFCKKLQ